MDSRRGRWLQGDQIILLTFSLAIFGGVLLQIDPGIVGRTIVAVPLVLVLPGYALTTALFPKRGKKPETVTETGDRISESRNLDFLERCALAVGSTIILLPFLGLVLLLGNIGISYVSVLGSLAGITAVSAIIGLGRRIRLQPAQRYILPRVVPENGISGGDGILGLAVTGTLCLSIIIAVGAMGFALAYPQTGETYSDLYLVTDGDDGVVAGEYPEEVTVGESVTYGIGLHNNEGEHVNYSVVVELESINETGEVTDRERLAERTIPLDSGEMVEESITVSPELVGEDQRVSVYLYLERVPWQPDHENAPYSLYTWLSVDASE